MLDSKMLPRDIFLKREEIGVQNSINMLFEIIEKDKDEGRRKGAIKYLGLISHNSTILKNECFEILENALISDEKKVPPQTLATIPFPSLNLKGLVRFLELDNETLDFGTIHAAIVILFSEGDDAIFYKYLRMDRYLLIASLSLPEHLKVTTLRGSSIKSSPVAGFLPLR